MDKYLMAIDAGTGSVRAVIFDLDGNQISCEQREWFHKEDPRFKGSMDFDWKYGWNLTCQCIQIAIQKANIDKKSIIGISTTCMREGIVLYDENLNEIWACANVDARANDEVSSLIQKDKNLELELYKKSGQTFALDALPRLLWVKNKQPEIYEKIKYVGMFNDWLIYKLTGVLKVEPSNGSTSGLFDLKTRKFDKTIAELCDIRSDIFPESIECGTKIATVNQKGAEDTGLQIGTEVIVGGGDAQLGSIGVGVVEDGDAAVFGGSFWQYEYTTNTPIVDANARIRVNCHAVPNMWQFEAIAFKPGLAMRWFRDVFCHEEKLLSKQLNIDTYDILNLKAKDVPIGSNGMLVAFSDVMNFRSWRHASPTFANFDFDPDKFDKYTFYRSILENTSLITLGHINLVNESIHKNPNEIIFASGASKSDLWSTILCDCLGIKLKIPVVKEATALGAAILAGYGLGIYKDLKETSNKLVKIEKIYTPNERNHEKYLKINENFSKFYKAQLELADNHITNYMWSAPGL